MSKRRKPIPKKAAVEVPVVVPVAVVAEIPPVRVVKFARPVAKCVRCGRTGDGMLCRRCAVVLGHSGQKEARLYSKPVNPLIGY
jgi:hypothetical protein